jgi:hypothetical protein
MLTLFRCALFDGWGDILYINYYGCDKYSMGVYTNDPMEDEKVLGGVMLCTPNPVIYLWFTYVISMS